MNEKIVLVILVLIVLSGCFPTEDISQCDFESETMHIIGMLEYREGNHSVRECFGYCKSKSFVYGTFCANFKDENCLEVCK